MRLFIAIPPGRSLRRGLVSVQDALRARGVQGNFTSAENLHLTLAFIGEYGDPERVLEAMDTVRFSPIPLRLEGIGAFDTVWWARLNESEALDTLAKQLRRTLAEAEIPFDRKRFRAHITLVRKPVFRRNVDFDAIPVPAASMTAERMALMSSTRGKHGMIYTEIGEVRCTDDADTAGEVR